ncbi:MAG TPA: radical SAM protein [Thermaerobacter sp.]
MQEPALLYSARPDATVLSPDRETVVTFDREGRLFHYYRGGLTYRRDLASRVYVRERGGEGGGWRPLPPDDARRLMEEAYAIARDLCPGAPGPLRQRLEDEILRWTPEALQAEADRFRAAYTWAPSILPPDLYLAIVLQATTGCTWNRCAFCALYRDRPFQARSPAEFADHAAKVRELLGRQWPYRQGIFLGDGNALALPLERLEPLIHIARRFFPGQPLYGFVDLWSGQRGDAGKWPALARYGFKRVYVGMETGLDELLHILDKPGSAEQLVAFVQVLKAAGLNVGLIIMAGVGGKPYARRHVEATVEALAAMPLGPGDVVYISPFIEQPGTPYLALRQRLDLTPLSEAETEEQVRLLAGRIRRLGVRVSRYDLRAFLY